MRFQSYFNTAIKIIQLYDGVIPLNHFLRQYFSQHKKHGSKDRKIIANICFNFYRLGKSFSNKSIEEKLKIAIYVCNDDIKEWNFLYDDEWLNNQSNLLAERIAFIQTKYTFSLKEIFPFTYELSEGLDIDAFIQSFFIQPNVFIRIRPGFSENVISKLQQHKTNFNYVDENCVAFEPSISINSIIKIDEEAVIQDHSSQRIKELFHIVKSQIPNPKSEINTWDCCAGSGGKSILAYDVFEKINLTVSDIRESIIHNLKERFKIAGIKKYKSFVADIINPKFQIPGMLCDLIIFDAPCTGSGTWSRTPEQLYFFNPERIGEYVLRQEKIISNLIHSIKQNGYLLYITCSVFKKENEMIADFIKEHFDLNLIKMQLIKGYTVKADTMFAALFQKN